MLTLFGACECRSDSPNRNRVPSEDEQPIQCQATSKFQAAIEDHHPLQDFGTCRCDAYSIFLEGEGVREDPSQAKPQTPKFQPQSRDPSPSPLPPGPGRIPFHNRPDPASLAAQQGATVRTQNAEIEVKTNVSRSLAR